MDFRTGYGPVLPSYRATPFGPWRHRLCYAWCTTIIMSRHPCRGIADGWDERGQRVEVSNEQYGQIVDWMDRQKRQIAELESENRELRRQLDELRRGIGVSLVIQGRALPVTVLPSAEPTGPIAAAPAPTRTGEYPARYPASVITSPTPQPYPMYPAYPTYSAPLPAPVSAQPSFAPLTPDAVRATPAPDSMWLTSHTRAVRAPAAAPAGGMLEHQRSVTPSQEMTPAWLRDDGRMPMPTVPPAPPSWPSTPQSTQPRPRTLASATGKQQAVRSPLRQGPAAVASPAPGRPRRPTLPHLEPEHLPSLAQMTGRQPVVRLPGTRSAERTPFSDSFVLG